MKIKTAALIASLFLLVGSCKYFKHNDLDESSVNYPMLDSASVFDSEAGHKFHPSPEATVYSRKLYLKAIDLFVNKKKTKESLPLFLLSLRIAPEAYTYFKYAEALYTDGQYKPASEAYVISYYFDQTIKPDGLLGRSRCNAMQNDTINALYDLEWALKEYPAL